MIPNELYNKKGYLNMPDIIKSDFPFIFIAAARGTGKTYGTLKYLYSIDDGPIIHLRRTQKEADLQNKESGSSFKSVFNDIGSDFHIQSSNNIGIVYDQNDKQIAFNMALSTFASTRGMDFSNVKYVFYDEFIAEPSARKIKAEGFALANFYESVNRNRELEGCEPVKMISAANSLNMANDIFMYFDLVNDAEQMLANDEEIRAIGNKLLIIPQHSPISEKKAETALYKAVNNEFSEMAIHNKFILNDQSYVKRRPLKEYNCILQLGDLFIFEHKSRQEYYITFQKGQTKNRYTNGYADRQKARRSEYKFVRYYLDGLIRFESFNCIALFENYFDV